MDSQPDFDRIIGRNIEDEMRESFIQYSLSVIVARALPDVRDGLKPVHRRIIYAMNELNLDPTKAYKKSARIVGDTMGKYHPHGDSSIYDAMVRMAQDFSMRYMLVDGHGNFGSVDGDPPAAQRYTEARLSRISTELIADIEKDTVDFTPNYDEEFTEPSVLPARFPNLLVNGSTGIAVAMATNIPPHNLNEIIDAVVTIIDNRVQENRETEIAELLALIKGPDFPSGANILGTSGIKQAYRTGRGRVLVRAEASIETAGKNGSGRESIIVTELPYQVNKAKLVEKIGELVREKKIEGISDLRDESNRDGQRIVIEIKKDTTASVVLNKLYKNTQMQETFSINMIALVNNEPKLLNIKEMLDHYIEHQKDVVTRRTKFDLAKAKKRAHILEGYLIALDHIDEVISIIRASKDIPAAKASLIERFMFSDEQAAAIVEMRLGRLTGLERDKIQAEHAELIELIKELTAILEDEKRLYGVIREEISIIKTKFGDERRTRLIPYEGELEDEDLINPETSVITLTLLDYIKRLPLSTYKSQNRGGKGVIGLAMRDEDLVKDIFIANTLDTLLFFTSFGRVYRMRAYEIPEAGRTARGMAIVNKLNLQAEEKSTAVIPIKDIKVDDGQCLIMVTKKGIIKRTSLSEFKKINRSGLIAVNLQEGDELITVLKSAGDNDLIVVTNNGMGIRFNENDVRRVGRSAMGVRAIRMGGNDFVVGAALIANKDCSDKVLTVTVNGYGKCTEPDEFRCQNRSGKGVKIYKVTEKTGKIAGLCLACEKDELMIINSEGVVIRIRVADISTTGRVTQGVKLINLNQGVSVMGITKIAEDNIDDIIDENIDDLIGENIDDLIDENIDDLIGENIDDLIDENIDYGIDEGIDYGIDDHVDDIIDNELNKDDDIEHDNIAYDNNEDEDTAFDEDRETE